MVTPYQMQRALNGLASAQNRAIKWREVIEEYSIQKFGITPGDADCDGYIIETLEYGASPGMSVEEFDDEMRFAIELNTTA